MLPMTIMEIDAQEGSSYKIDDTNISATFVVMAEVEENKDS